MLEYNEDERIHDNLIAYYSKKAYEESQPEEELPDLVAHCDWCREPIYDTDSYFHDTGSLYFCLECLRDGFHNPKTTRRCKNGKISQNLFAMRSQP